jgi:hypothetical protein
MQSRRSTRPALARQGGSCWPHNASAPAAGGIGRSSQRGRRAGPHSVVTRIGIPLITTRTAPRRRVVPRHIETVSCSHSSSTRSCASVEHAGSGTSALGPLSDPHRRLGFVPLGAAPPNNRDRRGGDDHRSRDHADKEKKSLPGEGPPWLRLVDRTHWRWSPRLNWKVVSGVRNPMVEKSHGWTSLHLDSSTIISPRTASAGLVPVVE